MDTTTLRTQLHDRRHALQEYLEHGTPTDRLLALLHEVDSALARVDAGLYGICEQCHEPIEDNFLRSEPLARICLDHMNDEQKAAIERDLELAARVQGKLLPSCNNDVDGWQLCYHYEPLGVVGGDYCDFIPPEKSGDDLYFFLGDVSGKGVSASMLVFHLHAMFRSLVAPGASLARLVERANRQFCDITLSSNFATLVAGKASADGTIELCNAGHCRPLVMQAGKLRSVERMGLPLGVSYSATFETRTIRFSSGDHLLLYSDGVTETFNPLKEEYSDARLSALIATEATASPEQLIGLCVNDLASFRASAPRRDDVTIFAMKRK